MVDNDEAAPAYGLCISHELWIVLLSRKLITIPSVVEYLFRWSLTSSVFLECVEYRPSRAQRRFHLLFVGQS
ncbi:hypothetical protein WJ63_01590 [Burkholderia pyrrocinia]|nr:hypothetical protein WJ63_01590 [Burkholderia pyrrocinia]